MPPFFNAKNAKAIHIPQAYGWLDYFGKKENRKPFGLRFRCE